MAKGCPAPRSFHPACDKGEAPLRPEVPTTLLPHFPFDRDTWSMHMGIRSLREDEPVFEVSGQREEALALKARLLEQDAPTYSGERPGSRALQWEALGMGARILARQHPEHFGVEREGETYHFIERKTGEVTTFTEGDDVSLPCSPLEWLGRRVEEDVMVLDGNDPAIPLVAGCLCFPSMWSLQQNLGRSFEQIHQPVPHFAEKIGRSSRLLMEWLKPSYPVTRLNWGMYPTTRLDLTPGSLPEWEAAYEGIDEDNAGERVHLRIERQVLLRLPRTHGIFFTIHIWVGSIAEQLGVPGRAARIAEQLHSLPEDTERYKRLAPFREPLITWLRRRAELPAPA